MPKERKIKKIGLFSMIVFLLGNFIIYNHAYRFSHFDKTEENVKTKKPEELSISAKIKTLIFGVNISKPKNKAYPTKTYETVTLKSNETLEAWHIKMPDSKGTIIMFHGYSSSKSGLLSYAEAFNQKGYSTFLVDFMGSGGSSGHLTTIGLQESKDVKVAYEFIKTKQPNHPILLFGCSMGAVAIMKAIGDYEIKPEKIILECPFGNFKTTTKARFKAMNIPSFPLAELLLMYGGLQLGFNLFEHNPTDYAKKIGVSTLLLYGAKDMRVSRTETDAIYQELQGHKQLGILENSGHEVYLNKDREHWNLLINDFLESSIKQSETYSN